MEDEKAAKEHQRYSWQRRKKHWVKSQVCGGEGKSTRANVFVGSVRVASRDTGGAELSANKGGEAELSAKKGGEYRLGKESEIEDGRVELRNVCFEEEDQKRGWVYEGSKITIGPCADDNEEKDCWYVCREQDGDAEQNEVAYEQAFLKWGSMVESELSLIRDGVPVEREDGL